jgi:hypothetical protein
MKWESLGVGSEGEPILISGVNVWDLEWEKLEKPAVELPHPSYPKQIHKLDCFRATINGKQVEFVAGELSANVWIFFIPA